MTIASEHIDIEVDPAARSGVAWGAIVGGALAAAAISLLLMVLGAGLGLSVVSPWAAFWHQRGNDRRRFGCLG